MAKWQAVKMWKCPVCGKVESEQYRICPNCNSALKISEEKFTKKKDELWMDGEQASQR